MTFRRLLRPLALAAFAAIGASALLSGTSAFAGKHPEPSVYPLRGVWYLDFKHAAPRRIVVDVPGQKVPQAYWYLTYTVTNNTGREVEFLPTFELVTEDGNIHVGDRAIPLPVFNAIKKQTGDDLLVPASQVYGTLHQGEDQARDSVAIWEEPPTRLGRFSIYVSGLNSEFVAATDNDGKPILDADSKQITLRKTLELDFRLSGGNDYKPGLNEVEVQPDKWIMR